MNESLLHALIKLFAIVANVKHFRNPEVAAKVVEKYFLKNYGKIQSEKCAEYFKEHLQKYHLRFKGYEQSKISQEKQIKEICAGINREFEHKQKVWIILQLLEFLADSAYVSKDELILVKQIALNLYVDEDDFEQSKELIIHKGEPEKLSEKHLLISADESFSHPHAKHLYKRRLIGKIYVLQLEKSEIYLFKYIGENNLFLNGVNIKPDRVYIWGSGAVIRGKHTRIYYTNIVSAFIHKKFARSIKLSAREVSFKFKRSNKGLKHFSLDVESGQLVGIIGGSGSGKSTMLNVLNGNLEPASGKIFINGFDLQLDKEKLFGLIGYVPQEDLLFEELSVYENLYYNAKLCFSDYDEDSIEQLIKQTLEDFDLKEAKDLKVGDPLNKVLSGGQRKRLNIALELMREPAILFVDEPSSGLSSMDSEKIINLLKRQTFKEKLVITTIHQPSSDIYKLFDKIIVLDQGGVVIYIGNPLDAITYFRKHGNYINPDDNECSVCGNVNSEQILRIIESRVVNEFGKLSRKRKRPPEEWEELYKQEIAEKRKLAPIEKKPLPDNKFNAPDKWKQFSIFFKRNIKSKLSNVQYILLLIFEAPALAFILAVFTKQYTVFDDDIERYIFANNENIPAYIFMSIISVLFLGLVVSAEEILRDRKIIKREAFLNLSRSSYINSKVLYLMIISAGQTLLFVWVGNNFLEINTMTLSYWLIFFSTAVCANLIGLNLSAALNSVVSAYIAIPFILVPQLLLSGIVVDFTKMHKDIKSIKYTPLYSDLMTTRWAYEALMVNQFKNNLFERNFYELDQKLSYTNFYTLFYIQKLEGIYENLIRRKSKHPKKSISLLKNEFEKLAMETGKYQFKQLAVKLETEYATNDFQKLFQNSLKLFKNELIKNQNKYSKQKDHIYLNLIKNMGSVAALQKFKEDNFNQSVANLVLNTYSVKKIIAYHNEIVQLKDPIFHIPDSNYGRAHFYAPVKRIGRLSIATFWFNLMIIWIMSLGMYLAL
ncbi:MAG: ATP-binding cassette domain-containing protein, partial [Bacteroidales bacterium]|nr:ATP-binding cassette domain-containing protein [Bacteroidales bacterium]